MSCFCSAPRNEVWHPVLSAAGILSRRWSIGADSLAMKALESGPWSINSSGMKMRRPKAEWIAVPPARMGKTVNE